MSGLPAPADRPRERTPPEYWDLQVLSVKDGLPALVQVSNGPFPTLIQAWNSCGRIKKFKPDLMFIAGELPKF